MPPDPSFQSIISILPVTVRVHTPSGLLYTMPSRLAYTPTLCTSHNVLTGEKASPTKEQRDSAKQPRPIAVNNHRFVGAPLSFVPARHLALPRYQVPGRPRSSRICSAVRLVCHPPRAIVGAVRADSAHEEGGTVLSRTLLCRPLAYRKGRGIRDD